jgi:hypothetical protein
MKQVLLLAALIGVFCVNAFAVQQPEPQAKQESNTAPKPADAKPEGESLAIPKGAKIFIANMPDNFHEFIKAAIEKKHVPVTIVESKELADFELTGFSETQKASTAKKIILGSWHSRESASIKIASLKSGLIAFAYSYNNDNSAHGKRTSAESCAKHLKEKIDSGK